MKGKFKLCVELLVAVGTLLLMVDRIIEVMGEIIEAFSSPNTKERHGSR